MNKEIETLRKEITWLFKDKQIEFIEPNYKKELNEDFRNIFPNLYLLISKAHQTDLKINNETFRLYTWKNKKRLSFGWLNKIDVFSFELTGLLDEHKLLLE
ncbi:hypothetical protein LFX15_18685 [Leptospira levettii]|uniref:hypothetical protein n=1 Tax=Leptospira levettii TaxID=2023178 RepID=UPI001EEA6BB1|nr:hypothetical protein [Leptospira levettii]MCG6150331.1 hypothetical protein [Leptospira levettii]